MNGTLVRFSSLFGCVGCLAATVSAQTQTAPVQKETTVTRDVERNGKTASQTWHKSTEVVGRPITSHGKNIGTVEDLVVDVNTGRVVYGVGSMSGTAGTGDRLYPIPWPAGQYSVQTRTYELPIEASRLESVPTFTRTEWPNFADDEFTTRTFKYYNQTPWWKTESSVVRTSDRPVTTHTTRWTQQPTSVHRITELRGRTIRSRDGVTLGPINEFVLDPHNGRILYAVTTRDGASVPIPYSALRVVNDKEFELSITADRWRAAPVIETERWTTMSEPQWSQRVYHHYEVKPDWDDDDDDYDHRDYDDDDDD